MKNVLFIAIMTLWYSILLAQNDSKTKIYFNNGSVLIADSIIISQDSSIEISMKNNVLHYHLKNIKKIVMKEGKNILVKENTLSKNKTYFNLQLSTMPNQVYRGFGINQSVLFRKGKNIYLGGGLGLENYTGNADLNIMPLYGTVKYYFLDQNKTPFISARYGYGLVVSKIETHTEGTKGGSHFNAVVGLRLWGDYFMTEIFGGIKRQSMTLVEKFDGGKRMTNLTANRLELGLSFMF